MAMQAEIAADRDTQQTSIKLRMECGMNVDTGDRGIHIERTSQAPLAIRRQTVGRTSTHLDTKLESQTHAYT